MLKLSSDDHIHDPLADPAPGSRTEVKTTTCYMCACRCGIRVYLRDGQVRYIDGNPEHPINKGVICAKGSSGIMKQHSPARLTQPLLRKSGSERGAGEFEPISWDRALAILTERLAKIRATDPKKFALFTGRDQMQALTGMFARQFGTPNYAAHGGFCSVNMAAGMIYTIGGSFWEFGGPDLDRARLFVMIGTAEDHHSNPLKIALSKFKRSGGRFISINPVRTGYSAIADEWIPIKPGTDGALFMALLHELLRTERIDHAFLKRFTNAPQLVNLESGADEGTFVFDPAAGPRGDGREPHNKFVWDKHAQRAVPHYVVNGDTRANANHDPDADPALEGEYRLPDGTRVAPAFQLLRERVASYTPEWAARITGIPALRIKRLAQELADVAFNQAFTLPIAWTDAFGAKHDEVIGRPVAFHAMRGLAAHSNGFQTVRALAVLMSVLGTIDRPGGFLHKAPYPRHIVPNYRTVHSAAQVQPNTPLPAAPLGFPAHPEELALEDDGSPIRIDKGFSWEHPLSAHGVMHNVITNAVKGDPYRLDTLLIFMANMAWNSTMNTMAVRDMLNAKDEQGEYKLPFLVVCDAFQSEMVAFADLVLPDTTYLERHDALSMLDRPISEFDGPCDSVRVPVVAPQGQCRPFQDVLVDLATQLKLPAFLNADGSRKYKDYADLVVRYEHRPGIGFLMGWRGADGSKSIKGEPNPDQWQMYAQNNCVFHYQLPEHMRYMRNWNRDYLDFAMDMAFRQKNDAVQLALYSDVLQFFRLAAQGKTRGRQPPERLRERVATLLRSAAVLVCAARGRSHRPQRLSAQRRDAAADGDVPLVGFAERLAAPDPQPQLPVRQSAHRARRRRGRRRLAWVESQWGKVRCMAAHQRGHRAGHGLDLERDRQGQGRLEAGAGRRRVAQGLPAQSPDQRGAAVRETTGASATPIRSPARPAGTTCACACGPWRRTRPRRVRRRSAPPRRCPA